MKLILLLLFSMQTEINGVILNNFNQAPVPYAYIQVIGEDNLYTVADEFGRFSLSIPSTPKEVKLNFRSVGFYEKQVVINENNFQDLRIELIERENVLNEIILTSPKSKFKTIGQALSLTTGFGLSTQDAGVIFLTEGKGQLLNLHFHFSENVGFPEAPILISFYKLPPNIKVNLWDDFVLDSLQPLLNQPILYNEGRPGWNTLDLEEFDIYYNGNVLIHFLADRKNNDFLWFKEYTVGGRIVKIDNYGPSISYYEKLRTKKMFSLNRPDFGTPVRLVVNPLFRNRFLQQLAVALEYEEYR